MEFTKLLPKEQNIILEQYNNIREEGTVNMMDFLSVQRIAFDKDFYEFVNFTQNDTKKYMQILKAI